MHQIKPCLYSISYAGLHNSHEDQQSDDGMKQARTIKFVQEWKIPAMINNGLKVLIRSNLMFYTNYVKCNC